MSVTMPFVLTLPLSRYATARGKQKVCENEPMIYTKNLGSQIQEVLMITHPDFITEDLAGRPMYERLVLVNTIKHERPTPTDIIDRFVRKLLNAGRLNDNIKAIRVVLLELFPLRAWVLTVELNIRVPAFEIFRDIHLDTLVRRDRDMDGAVELKQLRENETRRTCAEDKGLEADGWVELVKSMQRARRGFQERRLLVGHVFYLVELLLFAESTPIFVLFSTRKKIESGCKTH